MSRAPHALPARPPCPCGWRPGGPACALLELPQPPWPDSPSTLGRFRATPTTATVASSRRHQSAEGQGARDMLVFRTADYFEPPRTDLHVLDDDGTWRVRVRQAVCPCDLNRVPSHGPCRGLLPARRDPSFQSTRCLRSLSLGRRCRYTRTRTRRHLSSSLAGPSTKVRRRALLTRPPSFAMCPDEHTRARTHARAAGLPPSFPCSRAAPLPHALACAVPAPAPRAVHGGGPPATSTRAHNTSDPRPNGTAWPIN